MTRNAAWPDLLFTEFHDILTGTSIPAAWESVRAMQARARIGGEEVLYDLTRRWSYRTLPKVDAHQVVVLIDSSKIGQEHTVRFAGLDDVDVVITDSDIDPDDLAALRRLHVEVVVA